MGFIVSAVFLVIVGALKALSLCCCFFIIHIDPVTLDLFYASKGDEVLCAPC